MLRQRGFGGELATVRSHEEPATSKSAHLVMDGGAAKTGTGSRRTESSPGTFAEVEAVEMEDAEAVTMDEMHALTMDEIVRLQTAEHV